MIPQNGAHLCSSDVYGGNVGYWEYKHNKQESSEWLQVEDKFNPIPKDLLCVR